MEKLSQNSIKLKKIYGSVLNKTILVKYQI